VNITPRNIFWVSSTVAFVGVAVSVVYFVLIYIPNRDRLQAQAAAETARATRFSQLEVECANRAKAATQQHMLEQHGITELIGFSNHYNRRLQKCVVEVDTAGNGSYASVAGRDFVDAYENVTLLNCVNVMPHDPKLKNEFHCEDADGVRIPPPMNRNWTHSSEYYSSWR
jgi:hypothetical protein